MLYRKLAVIYEKLESTTKKLEKRDILSELYKNCDELDKIVLLSSGTLSSKGRELGMANNMVVRIIMRTFGIDEKSVIKKFRDTGDLGLTAEYFSSHKKQKSFVKGELSVGKVFENLRKLPEITGAGSQDKKIALVSELLSIAGPKEVKYIIRTVLEDLRIGVAEGIVRDAIAKAFDKDAKEIEKVYNVVNNYGLVAQMAKKGKMSADMILGSPVRVMLADRAKDLEDAVSKFEKPAIEKKYDGLRVQIHKNKNKVSIFSRRMDDITKQFPEIAKWSRDNINADKCIVEGETIAVDEKGSPKPFQTLSRRIQRKYDIEKTMKEIPVRVNLFDLIYFNGSYMDKPLEKRWSKLVSIVKKTKNFKLADHIETNDIERANEFYKKSLSDGEEGVVVKNLEAKYQPGKRVGYWLKVKDILEPLDLVITGAVWGEGKRAKWLGSLMLSAKKGDEFAETCMLGSGLTDEELKEMTARLRKLIISEHGRSVKIKPVIVIEVGYEEIQKSTKYPTGYALRFPRLLRIRKEKKAEDADTVATIEKLYMQRGRK